MWTKKNQVTHDMSAEPWIENSAQYSLKQEYTTQNAWCSDELFEPKH